MDHPLITLSTVMALLGMAISMLLIPTIRILTDAKYRDKLMSRMRRAIAEIKRKLKKVIKNTVFWEVMIATTASTAITSVACLAT